MAEHSRPRAERARLPRATPVKSHGMHLVPPALHVTAGRAGGMPSTREACHTLSTQDLYCGLVTSAPCLVRAKTPLPEESRCPASTMLLVPTTERRGASLLSGGGGIALPATRSRRQTVLASGLCTGCVRPAAATASFPCRCRCRCLWTLGRVMSPGMLHRKLGFSPCVTHKDFVWRYFEIPNTPISHQTLSVFIFKNLRGFKGSRSVQWVTIHPVPVSPRSRGPAWAGGGSCGVAPAAF